MDAVQTLLFMSQNLAKPVKAAEVQAACNDQESELAKVSRYLIQYVF